MNRIAAGVSGIGFGMGLVFGYYVGHQSGVGRNGEDEYQIRVERAVWFELGLLYRACIYIHERFRVSLPLAVTVQTGRQSFLLEL